MKFTKIIFCLLLISLFANCKKESKNDLEIEIVSDTIICVADLNYDKLYYEDKKYDSIYDEVSKNIVKYKIHNNSNEKYLFVLDSDLFGVYNEYDIRFGKNKRQGLQAINFSLYSDKQVNGTRSEMHTLSKYLKSKPLYISSLYIDTLNFKDLKNKYNLKDMFDARMTHRLMKNCYIIYPNETKYFTTIINLPLRDYQYDYLPWNSIIEKNKSYKAGLTLYNLKEETEKYLTPDLKQEIKENGYKLFDGVIHSNKVPVKLISISDKQW